MTFSLFEIASLFCPFQVGRRSAVSLLASTNERHGRGEKEEKEENAFRLLPG